MLYPYFYYFFLSLHKRNALSCSSLQYNFLTMRKSSANSVVVLFFSLSFLSSCASLPKATVDMSVMLDRQIQVLEKNHIQIIDKYFEEQRYQALNLLDNEWYPNYLDRFFNDPEAEAIWNEIINNTNNKERISDLQEVVSIIQAEYMKMRDSLLLPLEENRREALAAVQEEYDVAQTMNNAILNNVASVNDIQEVRREYLSKIVDIGSIENKISTYLDRADKILDDAQRGIDAVNDADPKIKSVIERLNL